MTRVQMSVCSYQTKFSTLNGALREKHANSNYVNDNYKNFAREIVMYTVE